MHVRHALVSLAFLVPPAANAYIYVGNPTLSFHVTRPADDFESGTVVLHQLKMHKCNGQTITSTPDATIDPVAGWSTIIPGGDYCSTTLVWDPAMEIEGDTFVIEYDAGQTTVQLGSQIAPVSLTPVDVVSGSFSGTAPRLVLQIN
jgi:hypothetical protein